MSYFKGNFLFDFEGITVVQFCTLIFRFSKLQDLIGAKIFPLVLEMVQESDPLQTAIDRLNKLEKIGFLKSAQEWRDWWDLRNDAAHEYLFELEELAKTTNNLLTASVELVAYWKNLRGKIDVLQAQAA